MSVVNQVCYTKNGLKTKSFASPITYFLGNVLLFILFMLLHTQKKIAPYNLNIISYVFERTHQQQLNGDGNANVISDVKRTR